MPWKTVFAWVAIVMAASIIAIALTVVCVMPWLHH